MNNFIDIQIKPDAEFRKNVLLNKTFTKLHKALHDAKQTNIGVSFPNYTKHEKSGGVGIQKLGRTIRIHGDKSSLATLQQSNWLGGLSGYCDVSDILPVPDTIEGYRTVSRKQPTMTLKKLAIRVEYQKAKGILSSSEEVKAYEKQYKAKMFSSSLDNPYLELQSTSTGNIYRVFIELGELKEVSTTAEFNYFGLSKLATIPWF